MKIKVDDLSGIKLDYYVAVAVGVMLGINNYYDRKFNPTSNWCIAGKIIEDNNISTEVIWKENHKILYISKINYGRPWHYEYSIAASSNMLEAAMRCFVKSKLGDEVEDIE